MFTTEMPARKFVSASYAMSLGYAQWVDHVPDMQTRQLAT